MRIRWLDEARVEAALSTSYYVEEDRELGAEFKEELRAQLDFLKRFPHTGMLLSAPDAALVIRRVRTDRFQYGIVCALEGDEIIVVAVHHLHRRPDYWRPRLVMLRR